MNPAPMHRSLAALNFTDRRSGPAGPTVEIAICTPDVLAASFQRPGAPRLTFSCRGNAITERCFPLTPDPWDRLPRALQAWRRTWRPRTRSAAERFPRRASPRSVSQPHSLSLRRTPDAGPALELRWRFSTVWVRSPESGLRSRYKSLNLLNCS